MSLITVEKKSDPAKIPDIHIHYRAKSQYPSILRFLMNSNVSVCDVSLSMSQHATSTETECQSNAKHRYLLCTLARQYRANNAFFDVRRPDYLMHRTMPNKILS